MKKTDLQEKVIRLEFMTGVPDLALVHISNLMTALCETNVIEAFNIVDPDVDDQS